MEVSDQVVNKKVEEASKNVMQQFKLNLRGYVVNKIEGGDAPANSFEDIGKSRFMQLSTVKRIQVSLHLLKKKTKDNFLYLKGLAVE